MSANLITIKDFKTYKGINSEEADPIISLLIGGASSFVKEYTGRSLVDYAKKNKVEYFNALDYGNYMPDEFPILEVAELAVSTDGGVTYTVLTENTDYFVDFQEDMIINNTGYTGFVTSTTITHNSGRITYKGGYEEVPLDIKLATMDLVEFYRKEEYSPSKALQGASIEHAVFTQHANMLPPHIRRVLDLYRVL